MPLKKSSVVARVWLPNLLHTMFLVMSHQYVPSTAKTGRAPLYQPLARMVPPVQREQRNSRPGKMVGGSQTPMALSW